MNNILKQRYKSKNFLAICIQEHMISLFSTKI